MRPFFDSGWANRTSLAGRGFKTKTNREDRLLRRQIRFVGLREFVRLHGDDAVAYSRENRCMLDVGSQLELATFLDGPVTTFKERMKLRVHARPIIETPAGRGR